MYPLDELTLEQRLRLVEKIWDSIAADQHASLLTDAQRAELDRRLDAWEADGHAGRVAEETLADIMKRL